MAEPVKMLVIYRPKPGNEEEIGRLVGKHYPALQTTGLVTDEPATIYRATNKRTGQVFFVESFSWRDASAPETAHQMPAVMAVWEPMTPLLEQLELAVIEQVSG